MLNNRLLLVKLKYLFVLILTGLFASCQSQEFAEDTSLVTIEEEVRGIVLDTVQYNYSWLPKYNYQVSITNNIIPPDGYSRIKDSNDSFTSWLRHLPLNKNNTVYLYNGDEKYNQSAQFKVVDIDVGSKDLQQCADAVMRLRAEYLYASKQYDKIHFNYTNGVNISFTKWSSGFYPSLKGNNVVWVNSKNNSSYESFKKYMNNIFMYAGTASLEKEMVSVKFDDIQVGDVFIKGGFPGHAVIVIDVAIHSETNNKCFMIAQSYMPAQNIHILKNPNNSDLSPWYSVKECGSVINTPEWTFEETQLKRFE